MTEVRRGRPPREQPPAAAAFAHNVRRLRLARGWTQRQLADAAGVTVRSISSYELGPRLPYADVAHRIALALGSTVGGLLTGPEKEM